MRPDTDELGMSDEWLIQERPRLVPPPFDIQQIIRERDAQAERNEVMKNDWLLLTGLQEAMDSKDLARLYRDWEIINRTYMTPGHFARLKQSWSLLTKSHSPAELEQLTRDMRAEDFENLKRDYLVLNWTEMSSEAFEKFKENWLLISGNDCTAQENVVKRWLLQYVPYTEYRFMRNKEKVEYTRMCLERGADVNVVNHGGYSLLHMMMGDGLMIHAPLIEVLLSYGADATLRMPATKETALEIARTSYYKDHEDVVSLLQTAEKSARKNAMFNNDRSQTVNNQMDVPNSDLQDLDEMQKQWIQTIVPPYLIRLSGLFDLVDVADIDNLTTSVINYMYISRIPKTELKFGQSVNRFEKLAKMHQVFSRMCSKVFNTFDPHFKQSVNIEFRVDTCLSASAELVFLVEIDPDVEWVALKMYAVPWDIEYYVGCKASSKSRFLLRQKLKNRMCICSADLLWKYEPYLGEYQRRLLNWFR